jgi:pilus assembly protein Flp/PilA
LLTKQFILKTSWRDATAFYPAGACAVARHGAQLRPAQYCREKSNSVQKNLRTVNLPYGIIFYSEFTDAEIDARKQIKPERQGIAVRPRQGYFSITTTIWEFDMSKFISAVQAFIADENGVTAIEYGLIAALIGVAMATAAETLGDKIVETFNFVKDDLTAAMAP